MPCQEIILDPKCKWNISPFYVLPYSLNCLISAKDTMLIVFLLQMMVWMG